MYRTWALSIKHWTPDAPIMHTNMVCDWIWVFRMLHNPSFICDWYDFALMDLTSFRTQTQTQTHLSIWFLCFSLGMFVEPHGHFLPVHLVFLCLFCKLFEPKHRASRYINTFKTNEWATKMDFTLKCAIGKEQNRNTQTEQNSAKQATTKKSMVVTLWKYFSKSQMMSLPVKHLRKMCVQCFSTKCKPIFM